MFVFRVKFKHTLRPTKRCVSNAKLTQRFLYITPAHPPRHIPPVRSLVMTKKNPAIADWIYILHQSIRITYSLSAH